MDRLAWFNALPAARAEAELLACCGSRAWARRMAAARPFRDRAALLAHADHVWRDLAPEDWLEAFRAHPRVGDDPDAAGAPGRAAPAGEGATKSEGDVGSASEGDLGPASEGDGPPSEDRVGPASGDEVGPQPGREGARHADGWSRDEQAEARAAPAPLRRALAEGNRLYEQRFGRIFLIRAAGRGAEEVLANLRSRLANDPATELRIAADEQRQITRLRLERLLTP